MAEGYEPQPWDGKPLKAVMFNTTVSCATAGGSTYHGHVGVTNQVSNYIGDNATIIGILAQSTLGSDNNYGPTNVYVLRNSNGITIYAESLQNKTYDVNYIVFYK